MEEVHELDDEGVVDVLEYLPLIKEALDLDLKILSLCLDNMFLLDRLYGEVAVGGLLLLGKPDWGGVEWSGVEWERRRLVVI